MGESVCPVTRTSWKSGGISSMVVALVVAVLLATATFLPDPASAQSSVRPPDSAVENLTPGAADGNVPGDARGNTSDSEIWRTIRQGSPGNVTIPDSYAATLIQSQGEDWRNWRNDYVVNYGAMVLLGIIAVALIYFALRGRMRISGGRSGRVMPRFSLVERITHWFMAVLFVILGVSGLIILFGKPLLIPLIGKEAFAPVATAAMQGHNLFGPIFIPAFIAMLFIFMKGNGYRLVDLVWLVKGGGFLGGHPSSHRYNFGEKSWFWWAMICSIAISVTGVIMLFPEQSASLSGAMMEEPVPGRTLLQFSNLIHAIAAIAFIAFGLGHIYLGTIGMEGALEGMTRGYVDENWAREHHDLWYEDHKNASMTDTVRAEVEAAAGKV